PHGGCDDEVPDPGPPARRDDPAGAVDVGPPQDVPLPVGLDEPREVDDGVSALERLGEPVDDEVLPLRERDRGRDVDLLPPRTVVGRRGGVRCAPGDADDLELLLVPQGVEQERPGVPARPDDSDPHRASLPPRAGGAAGSSTTLTAPSSLRWKMS